MEADGKRAMRTTKTRWVGTRTEAGHVVFIILRSCHQHCCRLTLADHNNKHGHPLCPCTHRPSTPTVLFIDVLCTSGTDLIVWCGGTHTHTHIDLESWEGRMHLTLCPPPWQCQSQRGEDASARRRSSTERGVAVVVLWNTR